MLPGEGLDASSQCDPSWRLCFFFSSRRRHRRFKCDWSSDVCSSDLKQLFPVVMESPLEEVRERALALAVQFGDERALTTMRKILADDKSSARLRLNEIGRASCRERV